MEEITASVLMKWSAVVAGIAMSVLFLGLLLVGIGTNYLKWKRFDFDAVGMATAFTGGCVSVMCFFVFLIALFWRMLAWMLT